MPWSAVQSLLVWNTGSWNEDSNYPVDNLSSSERSTVEGYLSSLYNGSQTFASLLDDAVANSQPIRIGDASPYYAGPAYHRPATSGIDQYLGVNIPLLDDVYTFDSEGKLVQIPESIVIAHELSHYISGGPDPVRGFTQTGNYDYQGAHVRFENAVAQDLGISYNRVSYGAAFLKTDPRYSALSVGTSYSGGNTVHIVAVGDQPAGAAKDDSIDFSSRSDTKNVLAFGFRGDDTISSSNGNDYLWGGSGNDILAGGNGSDTLFGEAGENTLSGGEGNDHLFSSTSSGDSLVGGAGNDSLSGGAGADTFEGGTDADYIVASGGADSILGGQADDIAHGGDGNDFIGGGTDADTVFGDNGADTLSGDAGADNLHGGEGADSLIGGSDGGDSAYGEVGDDTLVGFASLLSGNEDNDTLTSIGSTQSTSSSLFGGEGNDTISSANSVSHIYVGSGQDRIIVHSGVGFGLPEASSDFETFYFTVAVRIYDGDQDDKLYWGENQLTGGGAFLADRYEEEVEGEEPIMHYMPAYQGAHGEAYYWFGSDLMIVTPNDTINIDDFQNGDFGITLEEPGTDYEEWLEGLPRGVGCDDDVWMGDWFRTSAANPDPTEPDPDLAGSDGPDHLTGDAGPDVLAGNEGDDVLEGGGGADFFLYTGGSGGFDDVNGGDGIDQIRATSAGTVIGLNSVGGIEQISGQGYANVRIAGSDGDNSLNFSGVALSDIEWIDAGAGADTILGSTTSELIFGADGADSLSGGDGDDQLSGEAANDVVVGGDGYDTVLFRGGSTQIQFVRLADGSVVADDQSGLDGVDHLSEVEAVYFLGDATWKSIDEVAGGYGTANSDVWISGTSNGDRLYGLGGDDVLAGGAGNDTVDGGLGSEDVAHYAGATSAFTLSRNADGSVTVTDTLGGEGQDRLINTEAIYFDGDANWAWLVNLVGDYGTAGDDAWIAGTDANDNLYGLDGGDVLRGYAGNDLLDGGAGDDEASYAGSLAHFSFQLNPDGSVTVTDTSGLEGVDVLASVETIYFQADNAGYFLGDLL